MTLEELKQIAKQNELEYLANIPFSRIFSTRVDFPSGDHNLTQIFAEPYHKNKDKKRATINLLKQTERALHSSTLCYGGSGMARRMMGIKSIRPEEYGNYTIGFLNGFEEYKTIDGGLVEIELTIGKVK